MEISYQKGEFDFDFDINLLSSASDGLRKPQTRGCNSISILKRKIKTVNSLTELANVRDELLHRTQKDLAAANEDHKQTYIKYKIELQKSQNLERELYELRMRTQDLLEKITILENQKEAEKCYIHQLQSLAQEKEALVKTLREDNDLNRNKMKNMERAINKEKKSLAQYLTSAANFVFHKKPLTKREKIQLAKYLKRNKNIHMESVLSEENCVEENDLNEVTAAKGILPSKDKVVQVPGEMDILTKDFEKEPENDNDNTSKINKLPQEAFGNTKAHENIEDTSLLMKSTADIAHISNKDDAKEGIQVLEEDSMVFEDLQADSGIEAENIDNEISQTMEDSNGQYKDMFDEPPVSVDTGRGSSLAFSCSEEGFLSPEYCMDSPRREDINKKRTIDRSTSPIYLNQTMERATSPIVTFESKNTLKKVNKSTCTLMTSVDMATSPMKINNTENVATSPMRFTKRSLLALEEGEVNHSQIKADHESGMKNIPQAITSCCRTLSVETNCSDSNDSLEFHLTIDSDDGEIEKILNNMRLTHSLITPIPCTPSVSAFEKKSPRQTRPNKTREVNKAFEHDQIVVINGSNDVNTFVTENKDVCNDTKNLKNNKIIKLTALGKLRQSLVPKGKIRKEVPQVRRNLRRKMNNQTMKDGKVEIKNPLNNKDAYEKAVKIMAELNAKKQSEVAKPGRKYKTRMNVASRKRNTESDKVDLPSLSKINTEKETVSGDNLCEAEDQLPCLKSSDNQDDLKEQYSVTEKDRKRSNSRSLSVDKSPLISTRVLRSSGAYSDIKNKIKGCNNNNEVTENNTNGKENNTNGKENNTLDFSESQKSTTLTENLDGLKDYNDLDLFDDQPASKKSKKCEEKELTCSVKLQDRIFCKMMEKHGISSIKCQKKQVEVIDDKQAMKQLMVSGHLAINIRNHRALRTENKETTVNSIRKKIEDGIGNINELPITETKLAMDRFTEELQKHKFTELLQAFILYLKDPQRKIELFNKIESPPAPAMTKSEQVLLYIVVRLNTLWPDEHVVESVLNQIEYTLFRLNCSPDFNLIDVMAHFYAILCRYINARSRLRLFILDAMYCLQFKAIPLIKHCLDVWMHILPLAHLGSAQTPLVIAMVYLLHFYKCEDRFNRVHEIRRMLHINYHYEPREWQETKILEMFKNAIAGLNGSPVDRKMLKLALIILAKRHGPQWCQNKIIQNIILPLLAKEDLPDQARIFCVMLFGPLMKPYPMDMKVHCEIIINQLVDMLDQNPSQAMEEAIFSSLLAMSKHNLHRVLQVLVPWQPKYKISSRFEETLKNFVREKPIRTWKTILIKISRDL